MTSPVGRAYATALALVLFFLMWAVVAAKPWAATAADPRLKALSLREQRLRREALTVEEIVARRTALYRRELAARRSQIAAARSVPPPATSTSVRIVTLPPITITRTS